MNNSRVNKILMTTDSLGGVWTYTVDLCKQLSKMDIYAALAVMGGILSDSQLKEISKLENIKLYESSYKLEWMDNAWTDVDNSGEWLLNIKNEFQPDIVHLNSYSHGALDWDVPVLIVGHSDVVSWWKYVKKTGLPEWWSEYKRRVKAGLEKANFIAAPSRFMLNELDSIYGPFKNKSVIYNGRDENELIPGKKENLIFGMGRLWDEAKNLFLLVDAKENIEWPVYLAGNNKNPMKDELLYSDKAAYLGNLPGEEIAGYLARASIFVLPAKYEPFGLGPLEAALSGCAMILGDIPSLREIWLDAALYINPDSKDALSEAVNLLIRNPELLRHYSTKALERAKYFSLKKMGKEYISLYNKLLSLETVAK